MFFIKVRIRLHYLIILINTWTISKPAISVEKVLCLCLFFSFSFLLSFLYADFKKIAVESESVARQSRIPTIYILNMSKMSKMSRICIVCLSFDWHKPALVHLPAINLDYKYAIFCVSKNMLFCFLLSSLKFRMLFQIPSFPCGYCLNLQFNFRANCIGDWVIKSQTWGT